MIENDENAHKGIAPPYVTSSNEWPEIVEALAAEGNTLPVFSCDSTLITIVAQ
jgi:hypothetical protein